MIGGRQYASRSESAVVVKPQNQSFPVIPYAGICIKNLISFSFVMVALLISMKWSEGQSSSDLLAENLSIMLGQLVKNISIDTQDQEVFTVGLYRSCIYISRGLFTTTQVVRVQLKGCSDNEVFHLRFTRGYDLSLREDWLVAMHSLSRLFQYLLSGDAKVGAIRTHGNFDTAQNYFGKFLE